MMTGVDATEGRQRDTGTGDADDRLPPGHQTATEADLSSAVDGLSGLLTATLSPEELLSRAAGFAVQAIPGADGACITMFDIGHGATVVASSDFVREIDDIQYTVNEGPCISASDGGTTIRTGSLDDDSPWPRFGPLAARLGVHSALSIPLRLADPVLGVINLYARAHHVFDEHAARLAEAFAGRATVAVHNARILAQTQRTATQLQTALNSRATIDQAIGIIRSRSGCGSAAAFDLLKTISQRENVRLNEIAARFVEDAVRRARARRAKS